jgi:hypothetical protein
MKVFYRGFCVGVGDIEISQKSICENGKLLYVQYMLTCSGKGIGDAVKIAEELLMPKAEG